METSKQPQFNYTLNAWEGSKYQEKSNLYGSSLSKEIRKELKEAFPNCLFSVTSKTYSGGQSISIHLMSANFNPFNTLTDEIKEKIKTNCQRSCGNGWEQALKNAIECYTNETTQKFYHNINQFYIKDDISMTEQTKEIMTKALGIVQSYNFDDSDSQIDYFHTNFYLHCGIGKWDKPFIQNF